MGVLRENNKYIETSDHIGDKIYLDKKLGNNSKPYRDLQMMMRFCLDHLGKSAVECVGHNYGLFKVNARTVEILGANL